MVMCCDLAIPNLAGEKSYLACLPDRSVCDHLKYVQSRSIRAFTSRRTASKCALEKLESQEPNWSEQKYAFITEVCLTDVRT